MKINAPFLAFFPLMLAFTGDVEAGQDIQNATGICQAALPVFDGQIRKRPLAIGNEGEASACGSCSLRSEYLGGGLGDSIGLQVLVTNQAAGTSTINCTMVAGWEFGDTPPLYVSMSAVVAPGRSSNMYFYSTEGFQNPLNLSCMLPPGTRITSIIRSWFDSPEP